MKSRFSYNISLEMIISLRILKWDFHKLSHLKWEPLLTCWSEILIWPLTWNENITSNFEVRLSYGLPLEVWTTTFEIWSEILIWPLIWNENLNSDFEVRFSYNLSLEMRIFLHILKWDSYMLSHLKCEPQLKLWSEILIWPLTWIGNLTSHFEVRFS